MHRGLRIAFAGAGGTGKTTTAEDLADKLGLELIPSASRIIYDQQNLKEEIVATWDQDAKWKLQQDIFAAKLEQDDLTPAFVSDRTALDHFAYCLMYCAAKMDNDQFTRMEAQVRKHMFGAYTHVFYFPWGHWEAESDGRRSDSKAWQSAIDNLILGHFVNWGVPAIQVPQDQGPEGRLEFILDSVRGDQ
jgi:predicted ATPase